jgi:hypothetical protein
MAFKLGNQKNIDLTRKASALKFNGNFDDYNGPLDGGAEVYRKALYKPCLVVHFNQGFCK